MSTQGVFALDQFAGVAIPAGMPNIATITKAKGKRMVFQKGRCTWHTSGL
jgi:hypothetical protein